MGSRAWKSHLTLSRYLPVLFQIFQRTITRPRAARDWVLARVRLALVNGLRGVVSNDFGIIQDGLEHSTEVLEISLRLLVKAATFASESCYSPSRLFADFLPVYLQFPLLFHRSLELLSGVTMDVFCCLIYSYFVAHVRCLSIPYDMLRQESPIIST